MTGTERCVVVGSGPNGLAAAIRLAQAGRPVTVLEAADQPGGAVRTQELTLPGFRHDTFSSVYPAAAASPVFARLPLAAHGLHWVHPAACVAHPLPDGSAVAQYRDVARTAASLDAVHPGDGERWATFAAPYLDAIDGVRRTMLSGFPPVGGPLRLLHQAGPARLAAFARQLPESAVGLGHRLFEGAGSRAWLYGGAMHGDTPPQGRGSAIAAFYLYLLGHASGWPSPRGGAGALSDALAGVLRSLGGEIRCGAEVQRITVAHGRVTGVTARGLGHVRASSVVATVMPHALLRLVDADLGRWYGGRLRAYRYGAGTVKVDWALDGPIPWSAPGAREAGTVHVAGDEETFLDAVERAAHEMPARPFLLLGQQSLADPTRAPEGHHTAWAYTHAPTQALLAPGTLEQHVARIEAMVERFAPGFGDRVLARHVLGPRELEERDANLVGGDVGGGSYRLSQLVFRPLPALDPYRTPVRGLVLGSAATFPGGAVHGVPGDAAARSALRSGPWVR
ncbi:phytoene desaturase family protein [Paraconexibacter algicola]|uniref:Pyridine nucleotide-disulfide oxidoreductase domain-containing protein 2 n=1 Tax=Paraconexibacter algicola TaxID=2133960 RepID=A0A2T4UL88_9ACTN|nr:NAD(P)/FAD-dependent oxidoreductase [Paraconexibacter algicola]PTL60003.1 FAD-dependent oxidoreductase [Paraconexibacter algicola]